MKTMRETLAAVLLVAAACFSTPAVSQFGVPVVHHALADTAAGTLTLDGQNFGATAGKAWLAKTPLAIQSWEGKRIVAALPAGTAPGNHLATIQTARLFPAFFVVSIGGASSASAAGSISGTVSACGAPVTRTLVYIPGRSFVVFTDASGAFRLDNVPPGSYDVLIAPPGQPATTLPGVTVAAGETSDTGTTVVVDLTTVQNCGACGNTCAASPGSAVACVDGQCQATACNAGFDNCDGNAANGCETVLNTLANCGACGVTCQRPNAIESCASGSCQLVSCSAGFADCDGNAANGCETAGQCPGQCAGDVQCEVHQFCSNGVCLPDLQNGGACQFNTQCQSFNCEFGTCETSCGGNARRCEPGGACIPNTLQCP